MDGSRLFSWRKNRHPDVKSEFQKRRSLFDRAPSGASTDPLGALDDPAAGGIGASR